ncbi:MAG: hypothetical protein H0W38_19200 [Methylibium sp.]|nr:hypothetical protein [Methylibium sp.]
MRTRIPNSLQSRVREFFEANQDEELTFEDICTKFGCSINAARNVVYTLVRFGKVESLHVIRPRAMGARKDS